MATFLFRRVSREPYSLSSCHSVSASRLAGAVLPLILLVGLLGPLAHAISDQELERQEHAIASQVVPLAVELPTSGLQPVFHLSLLGNLGGQTRAFGTAVADFTGDGKMDIVAGDTAGDVHLYQGNGDGTFVNKGVVINMPYSDAYALAAGDFNSDGKQDFILTSTAAYAPGVVDGGVYLYLGNGNGTFQSTGTVPGQAGILIGTVGTDVMSVAAGDVDGDGRLDVVVAKPCVYNSTTSTWDNADIVLLKQVRQGQTWSWQASTIVSAPNVSPIPDQPPYYPPTYNPTSDGTIPKVYGLAFGDVDGDGDQDLLATDRAGYLYVYANNGHGSFSPVRFDRISTGTRPYAYGQVRTVWPKYRISIATGDFDGDGRIDFVTGSDDSNVELWLNLGPDTNGNVSFGSIGSIGGSGTYCLGLAAGQVNPGADTYPDVIFGNYEGNISALLADRTDTDSDGIPDALDNAPQFPNAPRVDMNTDGGVNYRDQLDNDSDGIGDPADPDDDNDGVPDATDNAPFVANADQADADGDGLGNVSDPLNNRDTDGDGVLDGPVDPVLFAKARQAKGKWSEGTTHFIVRIDALGRAFQNEFTQIFTDAGILSPAEWETRKLESYNGIGDDPGLTGWVPNYQVPADLPGGKEVPITLVVIPKIIWNAFGDPDPVQWINNRIANPRLEIGQHGTYHANLTPYGDWAGDPTRDYYSSEMSGFSATEMFQFLRIGRRTLLGDYLSDPWIQQSGATGSSPKINWTNAANPLISFAPPFNASDPAAREATSYLGYTSFSASIWEENSSIFTPEGSHHEQYGPFGMFHASADLQVDPEDVANLSTITQWGHLNTWLIEEVEWSSRMANDLPRLVTLPNGSSNRENNMVDLTRWSQWLTLLDFVKANGVPMTMGDYSLAVAFDNAPTVANPSQADSDHNGIGDAIDHATLVADDVPLAAGAAVLRATLTAQAGSIASQTVTFTADADNNGTAKTYTATTNAQGVATASITPTLLAGGSLPYTAAWNGILITASDTGLVTSPAPPHVVAVTPTLAAVYNQSLPLNTVTIRFDKGVQIAVADVTVVGLAVGARNDFTLSYNASTFTATLTWTTPLANDTYRLTVKDTVKGLDNLALDGEQADPLHPSLPGGNGTAGGDFVGVIYRQAGDVNADRYVNVGDLQLLVAAWGSGPGYTGAGDLNADGYVNVGDLQILVANWEQSLPVGP